MNDEQRKAALELLNELVEKYEQAIIGTAKGNHRKALTAHAEALIHCTRLKELLASPPAESIPVTTVWVGLAPTTIERLLATDAEFSRQYEERSKTPGKSFIGRDGMAIEFVGAELGLCLGVRFLTLSERFAKLDLPTIILDVEEAKKKFICAMAVLGVSLEKELVEVFAQTRSTP